MHQQLFKSLVFALHCVVFINLYSDTHLHASGPSGHCVALPVREPLEKRKGFQDGDGSRKRPRKNDDT